MIKRKQRQYFLRHFRIYLASFFSHVEARDKGCMVIKRVCVLQISGIRENTWFPKYLYVYMHAHVLM